MVFFAAQKGDCPQFTQYFLEESLTDHLLYKPITSPLFICGKRNTSTPFVNQLSLPEKKKINVGEKANVKCITLGRMPSAQGGTWCSPWLTAFAVVCTHTQRRIQQHLQCWFIPIRV